MTSDVRWFEPPPGRAALPARMPSPFAEGEVHPLARRAADELMAELRRDGRALDAGGGGKMFGVLVVEEVASGRVGYLRAFSGMLRGRWFVDGFAPPLFDVEARDRFWPAGEAELAVMAADIREAQEGAEAMAVRDARAALEAEVAARLAALVERHRLARAARHAARAALEGGVGGGDAALDGAGLDRGPSEQRAALDQASRADTAERRRFDAEVRAGREAMVVREAAVAAQVTAAVERRAARSRVLLGMIHDSYAVTSGRGERRTLASLFAPEAPPGGAGDCAAPKLIAQAQRLGLRPRALAEVWWGPPPATGGRHESGFYPACRGKCGPIVPFQLDGEDVDDAPVFGAEAIAAGEPREVWRDDWLVIVDKPVGLLAVPGRHARLRDSVETRLQGRYGAATQVVHRLDLETSGLMIVARDGATRVAMQRLFAQRQVEKRYVAWLDGAVVGDEGQIALALRGDVDDRPRQVVDAVHGKPAQTSWRVLARADGRTRVELRPHTGRTHQLRVHVAHGLGAPIVGDRLYGRGAAGARMLLHAEALAFVHPHTGARVQLERAAPF